MISKTFSGLLLGILIVAFQVFGDGASAREPQDQSTAGQSAQDSALPADWILAAEASSGLYFLGLNRTDGIQANAVNSLRGSFKPGKPKLNRAYKEIFNVAGEHFKAIESLDSTEEENVWKAKMEVLELLSDSSDTQVLQSFVNAAQSATNLGLAIIEVNKARKELTKVWRERVLPAIQHFSGSESESPLIDVNVGFLRRSVWGMTKNVSGKDLNNVTLNLQIVQSNKYQLPERVYFIRSWRAGETIYLNPFTGHVILTPDSDAKPMNNAVVHFNVWSDEGSNSNQPAKIVAGYGVRDPFVNKLVRPNQKFVSVSDDEILVLSLTRVGPTRNGTRAIRATMQVTSLKNKKKSTTTLQGAWTENRKSMNGAHPDTVYFTLVGPSSNNARRKNPRTFSPRQNATTFRWTSDGCKINWNGRSHVFVPVP
ncbi:hypothetical protein FF011L_26640 [Roseimaritima multifibrata]|uniref:Uncharacterized protein n=1 Tax=Roseimaritima multifibrata TaxID=1930274 RepID=A0A517MG78_9BACT|nr:hypothetical protein [Roseimaritima multifibrata]QDS93888.1 hypothetical protein FF011L_26640 [Roseimaritima multifibrata]